MGNDARGRNDYMFTHLIPNENVGCLVQNLLIADL
jgi:hypothetical protein